MTKSTNNRTFARFCLHFAGLLLCIVPPAICTMMYFPLWKEAGVASCIAGGGALILVLCAVPLLKMIRRWLTSMSAYFMWLLMFLLFFALSRIADQMTVISFVGFVGNLLGALCFRLAKREAKVV